MSYCQIYFEYAEKILVPTWLADLLAYLRRTKKNWMFVPLQAMTGSQCFFMDVLCGLELTPMRSDTPLWYQTRGMRSSGVSESSESVFAGSHTLWNETLCGLIKPWESYSVGSDSLVHRTPRNRIPFALISHGIRFNRLWESYFAVYETLDINFLV